MWNTLKNNISYTLFYKFQYSFNNIMGTFEASIVSIVNVGRPI